MRKRQFTALGGWLLLFLLLCAVAVSGMAPQVWGGVVLLLVLPVGTWGMNFLLKEKLEAELKKKLDLDIRITIPGHTQRGGSPCPYDRVLSTRMGSAAAGLILKEEYGYMVGIVNGKIKKVPLADCAGKLKMVSPDDQLVKAAKRIGISFGD